ncbi:MAG: Purine nucleoside phosphorylase [Myxococcaceae bacterium]|nr:Purine nucleoside phosphorylase [Myxococcaceae bacterium]
MVHVAHSLAHVRRQIATEPRVALVLGSGLGGLADAFERRVSIPYSDIPGMPQTSVQGHAGQLVAGLLEGVEVVAMQGRLHPYEGHSLEHVVLGVRLMLRLGASTLIVTNASGGIEPSLRPGALLAITDHINLSGLNCLAGPNDPELGPRFSDMSQAYDPALVELASEVASEQGIELARGVYAGVLGPSYETPAEVRMLRVLGASIVGMSTVQEVIAARHMGARVLGISCVTNAAAGLSDEWLSHADVERTARASSARLTRLICGVVERLKSAP